MKSDRHTNPILKVSERQLQAAIIEIAKWEGWMVFHALPVQNQNGRWRTATQGHTGFPDLVMAHKTRGILFVELKTTVGRISDNQQAWIDTLKAAGAEIYVWRPRDLQEARLILRNGVKQ